MNKEELRKYLVKDKNINGLTFDKYVERVESMTRAVIEERPTNFREIDVFSQLIMDRIIFLGIGIEENISNIITAQLLFLESTDSKKDILLYINSLVVQYMLVLVFMTLCNMFHQMLLLYVLEWLHQWEQYFYLVVQKVKDQLLSTLEL